MIAFTATAALALFAAHDLAPAPRVAEADAIAVFPTVSPQNAVPSVDALIPTNAHVFAFVSDAGPSSPAVDATFTRFLTDGSSVDLDAEKITGVATAFDVDLGALTPGEAVIVQASCSTCTGQFTFTVGEADDVTAPVFADGSASRFQVTPQVSGDLFKSVTGYFVNGCLPAVSDDSNAVALRVELDDGTEGLLPVSGTGACGTSVAFTIPGGEAREVCMNAVAVDVAGNETPFPSDICMTLDPKDEGGGCAQTSSTSTLFAALALVALLRVRSRR